MKKKTFLFWAIALAMICLLAACGGGGSSGDGDEEVREQDNESIPTSSSYVLLAWNDLGMHCLNPTYDTAVILPPYNTVWAQLVRRSNPPQIVTTGVTLEYSVVNNTYSAEKTNLPTSAEYGQFWTYVQQLFGAFLEVNTGLNLVDPTINNGLRGKMVLYDNHFQVDGVPVTPVNDSGVWNPYQIVEITAKDSAGTVIAKTRATMPTSDEINCDKCHGDDPFYDILVKHDADVQTNLVNSQPVLCASCHGSPILETNGPGIAGIYLSEAIHGFHVGAGARCYNCHPGATTQCNRSIAHDADDSNLGNCEACHGNLQEVADSISLSGRVPWLDEPNCVDCHSGIYEVDTGETLYRNAQGHGQLFCAACHGSPHAMFPSRIASDNYQALQYQGKALSLGSCGVCHSSSKGEGLNEFLEEHGGNNGKATACNVCHTSINSDNVANWPHRFEWKSR